MTEQRDKVKRAWYDALVAQGHTPVMIGDEINMWVLNSQHHNGPGCDLCDDCWCEHCLAPTDVGPCTGIITLPNLLSR